MIGGLAGIPETMISGRVSRGRRTPGHSKSIIVSLPPLNSPITFLVSTMEPAEFDDDANANGDGNCDSSSGEHAAACTSPNAESVFISKNSSLKALALLSAGLKNDNGTTSSTLRENRGKVCQSQQLDHRG